LSHALQTADLQAEVPALPGIMNHWPRAMRIAPAAQRIS
jgi:hypothetical protein